MLNRAIPSTATQTASRPAATARTDRPNLRLAGLAALMLLGITAIAARLVHVQTTLRERTIAEFERTFEKREPIASRDGRILAAGGEVLAEDVEHFGLKVHYRWLEEPPDPLWLRQQALSRLERALRRDARRVAAEEAAVLERRFALWQTLARLPGVDSQRLTQVRRDIQGGVERIHERVLARRALRQAPAPPPPASATWSGWAWQTLVAALTTPPRREEPEPLVVQEQLDYHLLLADIPFGTAVEIEAHPERYPGTRIDVAMQRVYPQGEAAAHLIGYRTPLDDEALRDRRERFPEGDPLDYRPGDRQGRSGLERYYETHLRGLRGERRLILDSRGELLRSNVVREPRFGRDLVLWLELPVQQAAEQLLDDALAHQPPDSAKGEALPIPQGGAIVALDVRNGAVLAAASAPRFDLKLLSEFDSRLWSQMLSDARKPMFHRAAEMALPPGSTFKVVSAVALVASGRIDPEQTFFCQGFLDSPERYRCFNFRNFGVGHGDLDLVGALARSCNVYFFAGARRIGSQPLCDWAERFGFGRPTGIDLPGEAAGRLPSSGLKDRQSARSRGPARSSGETLQLAIGQGQLTATPLQLARMIAAIANGGRLVRPRLAESAGPAVISSVSGDERVLSEVDSQAIPELSPRVLGWVRLGLQQVVAHPQGTGYKTVRLQGVTIAGKTGTAEAGGGKPDHAWFAGYAPVERPRVAFVVVLEHAGSGGHAAGPVAREFVQALAALGVLTDGPAHGPLAN